LQEAVRLDPATVPARVKLAEALMAEGDIASAATVYEDLARVAPDLPHAQYGLGRVKAAQGRRDEALQHYRKACALFDEYGAAHYALALLYRDVGDKDKSRHHLTLYEQHKMTAPAVPDPFVSEVRALRRDALDHIARGIALSKSNDLAGAIEAHERALAADATLEQARVNLIILYGKTGDTAAAERHYRALMASNPGLADGHYNFGIVLLNAGRYPEAKEAFRAAIAANPALPAAHNNLGQLLEGEALVEEAAAHYRRAVDADPQYRLARFNLGRMLVALKRHDEAVEQFERLLAGPRDAETPRHLFALATAHVHAGRRDEGVRLATEAQALAVKHGQQELAAAIERDLRRLQGQP
jgi:tetratricopeptide (TPR) repeat protein